MAARAGRMETMANPGRAGFASRSSSPAASSAFPHALPHRNAWYRHRVVHRRGPRPRQGHHRVALTGSPSPTAPGHPLRDDEPAGARPSSSNPPRRSVRARSWARTRASDSDEHSPREEADEHPQRDRRRVRSRHTPHPRGILEPRGQRRCVEVTRAVRVQVSPRTLRKRFKTPLTRAPRQPLTPPEAPLRPLDRGGGPFCPSPHAGIHANRPTPRRDRDVGGATSRASPRASQTARQAWPDDADPKRIHGRSGIARRGRAEIYSASV